jgi:polyhydroxybutyrate depolymerase
MGTRRNKAGVPGLLVMAALAACVGGDTAAPTAVAPATPVAAPMPAPMTPAPTTTVAPAPVVADAEARPAPVYLPAGVHEHQVDVDGVSRRWTTVAGGGPATGVVVVLHGVGGRGADMRSTGFEPLAAARGVVMAYPDAHGGAWNDGRPGADPVVSGTAVDDGRFLRVLIDETAARTGADARRVAVVGFSAGAVMASRLACDLGDRVTALALVAGTAGQGFERSCRPARPIAVMMVAGVNDPVVPYAGGRITNWGTRRRGFLAGVDELFAFWRGQNGCTSMHTVGAEARGTDCRTGSPVVRYRVNASAHEWYRAPRFDTTNVIWEFLQRRFSTVA